jgi:hypothetical protein
MRSSFGAARKPVRIARLLLDEWTGLMFPSLAQGTLKGRSRLGAVTDVSAAIRQWMSQIHNRAS